MKKKVSVLVLVGLVLLLVFAVFGSQALAKGGRSQKFMPFKAEYIAYPEPLEFGDDYMLLVIPGEGKGTHLGKSTWLAESMRVDLVAPPQPQVSSMIFTASNGDELYGHFFGFGRPNDIVNGNYFWGGYELRGGTGKLEGASGSGLYHGTCREICTVTFEGNLYYP